MSTDAHLTGDLSVRTVARRLKEAGNGQLRRDLLKGIRTALKPVVPAIARGAEERLPRRGGLAAQVAGQRFAVRTSLASGSVKITGSGMKELSDIDQGRLRHPVFGKRSTAASGSGTTFTLHTVTSGTWVRQSVTPGFFTAPIEARLPVVKPAIESVLRDVTKKLESPL